MRELFIVDKTRELQRMQIVALLCLVAAAAVFIATFYLPPSFSVRLVKAGAEAAMVGGLADWFAVVALFKHPLRIPIPHTAIIPKSKDRIAENLAEFVREKFLNPEVLKELIQRSNPAHRFSSWLEQPANAHKVGRHTADLLSGWLDLIDDRRIQLFIGDAAKTAVGKMDFSKALASMIEMLTIGGRHQQLLDATITQMAAALQKPEVRTYIAKTVVDWLKTDHKKKEMFLPTEWIGDQAADAAHSWIDKFLKGMASSPSHDLRIEFDKAMQKLIDKLKNDDEFQRKGEELKAYVQNDPQLLEYARSIWAALREWISRDLELSNSQVQTQVEKSITWLGKKISQDEELSQSLNDHLGSFAHNAAPQFADFLTCHISDTIRKWDAQDMSRQIELSIGPDLQYIRISGTAVGFLIGVCLFLITHVVGIGH